MRLSRPSRALLCALLLAPAARVESATAADETYDLARAACALGEYDAAIKLDTRAIAIDPHHACAHHHRAWCHEKLGHRAEAKADYLAAIDLVCTHISSSHEGVAALYLKEGDAKQARYHADMAIGLAREERVRPYLLRGDALLKQGALAAALEDYAAALEANPGHWRPHAHRARALARHGDFRGAFGALRAANNALFNGQRPARLALPIGWIYLVGLTAFIHLAPGRWRRACEKEAAFWTRRKMLTPKASARLVRFNTGRGFRALLALMLLAFAALTIVREILPLLALG